MIRNCFILDSHDLSNESSTNRLDRFRLLFTRNIGSDELNRSEHHPLIHSTRELPPPYSEEQLALINHENNLQPSRPLIRIHKQQIPLNPIENHFQAPSSSSVTTTTATILNNDDDDDVEQASCDINDDDDKLLVP